MVLASLLMGEMDAILLSPNIQKISPTALPTMTDCVEVSAAVDFSLLLFYTTWNSSTRIFIRADLSSLGNIVDYSRLSVDDFPSQST